MDITTRGNKVYGQKHGAKRKRLLATCADEAMAREVKYALDDKYRDKRYNGWTNYETWAVSLWMNNDEGSYQFWQSAAQEAWNESSAPSANARLTGWEPFTRAERAALRLRDILKDSFEEGQQEVLSSANQEASVWADLLGAAMSDVNWYEIATSLVDDADKTEGETEEVEV